MTITYRNYCGGGTTFGVDKVGHGTLVAGLAVGNPSGSPQDLKGTQSFHYGMGLAPGAGLYVQRIIDSKDICGNISTWAPDAIGEKVRRGSHSVVQTHSHNDYALAFVNGFCVQVSDGV